MIMGHRRRYPPLLTHEHEEFTPEGYTAGQRHGRSDENPTFSAIAEQERRASRDSSLPLGAVWE
jgi:hypothetical protein